MELRRRQRAHLPYRSTLWFLVGVAALVLFFDSTPWIIDEEIPEGEPLEIQREASSDVLLVLDYVAIRDSGETFEERDFSAAWINLFEQELGPVSIATPESLSLSAVDEARVIVLTRSVSGQTPDRLIDRIRERVLDGALLVNELPEGRLRDNYAANGKGGMQRGESFTFAAGFEAPYDEQMLEVPVATEFLGSTTGRERAETLLAIDGAPVIYSVPVGKGHVVTVDFDFGEQMVALQQGRPSSDFRVEPTNGDVARPADMIADPELQKSVVPYADLLERFVFWNVIQRYAPIPAFWAYPGAADGVVVALHEDGSLGDGGGWMLEYEVERKALSSLVTTYDSGMTASKATIINRRGGDLGIAWRMQGTPEEIVEPVGFGEIKPVARPVGLDAQIDALVETFPGRIVTSRVFGGWWSDEWAAPLRALDAHGVRIDTTYSGGTAAGYAFGTGFPFLAFDETGMPIGLREMPVVVPDSPTDGPSLVELLESSRLGHHSVITVAHDPSSFADYPDITRFESWLRLFDEAESNGHMITSAMRLDGFLRSRRAGAVRSVLVEGASVPTGRPKTDEDGDPIPADLPPSALMMRITVEAKARGMSLVIPETVRGKTFFMARQRVNRVGDELISGELRATRTTLVGHPLRLIALERGFNTIDVYFR